MYYFLYVLHNLSGAVKSAIWQLDTYTLDLMKIRDFPDYRDQQYTDTIEW